MRFERTRIRVVKKLCIHILYDFAPLRSRTANWPSDPRFVGFVACAKLIGTSLPLRVGRSAAHCR